MKVVLKKEVCGPINSARVLLKNHHSHKKSKTRFKRKKHRRKHGKSCIQTGTDWKKILLILRVRFGSAFCVSQIRLRFCLCFCFCFFFLIAKKFDFPTNFQPHVSPVYCSRITVLFTHLKIILLQCFSIFSF